MVVTPEPRQTRSYQIDDLIELVGISAAYQLCSGWGGTTLYVPRSMDWDHPIALAVGLNAAMALTAQYGGVYLDIPPEAKALRSRREELICADLRAGATTGDTARKYGLTQSAVRNMCTRNNIRRPPQ